MTISDLRELVRRLEEITARIEQLEQKFDEEGQPKTPLIESVEEIDWNLQQLIDDAHKDGYIQALNDYSIPDDPGTFPGPPPVE